MTVRPRLLTTIAATIALALAATATSLAVAAPASASRAHALGVTAYGNDIPWPQCPSSQGGYDLPGPHPGASFAVLGLTDGGSFRANPWIGHEVRAVKARRLWLGAYASTTSNNAVIDGVIARYRAAGVRVGIYSYDEAWRKIAGGRALPGVATRVPVGHRGRAGAAAGAAVPSFTGTSPC